MNVICSPATFCFHQTCIFAASETIFLVISHFSVVKVFILLRKIALPYPHKCLFGFVEQNVSTDKNFLRNILVTRGDPFVCACPRLRSSGCRQTIVERSSLYFWSIWEQHVFSFIIVHLQTKIYEVLKRASVHLPVFIHYSTGTTTNSASLVLKRVRIKMFFLSGVIKGITTVSPPSPGHAYKFLYLTEVGTRLEVVGIGGNVSKMVIG